MAYRLCKLLLFVALGLMIGCSNKTNQAKTQVIHNPAQGKWQQQKAPPLHFQLEQTYGNNKDLLFPTTFSLRGPVADSAGNIYVIDIKNGVMYSFDSNGNIRWKKGHKGNGPGDFNKPRGLAVNGNYLFTANVQGSRIDKFNLKGNLLNSTPVKNFDLSFSSVKGFISDSLLVITSTTMGTLGEKITILNTTGSLHKTHQFDIIPSPDLKFSNRMSMGLSTNIINSLIAAGNSGIYTIIFYNKNGKKVRSISRDFDKLVRFGHYQTSSGSAGIGSFGSLDAPIDLQNGYYLVHLSWPTNVKNPDEFLKNSIQNRKNSKRAIYKNALDLYSADGTLLYSQTFDGLTPNIGNISYVDSHGNVYTTSNNPYPQIRRYHVTITPPAGKE